jgi:transporter family protein
MPAIVYGILSIVLWGVAPVVEKVALREVNVLPAVCIRSFAISSLLLLYLTATRSFGSVAGHPWHVYALIVIGGTCASLIGQATFFKALKSDQASLVVPLVATYPMVTTIGALLFLGENLSPRKAAGIVLALVGAYLLSGVKPPPAQSLPGPHPPAQASAPVPGPGVDRAPDSPLGGR